MLESVIVNRLLATVATKTIQTLSGAYTKRQEQRINSFIKYVDTRFEVMTTAVQQEYQKTLNSDVGQKIIADYAEAITKTESERVRMAIALLYCKDSDFEFNEVDIHIFINGITGISDQTLDIFLELVNINPIENDVPYKRHSIYEETLYALPIKERDAETLYSCVNELITRRLLLPDPKPSTFGSIKGWSLTYGSSNKSIIMANLIKKSALLIEPII